MWPSYVLEEQMLIKFSSAFSILKMPISTICYLVRLLHLMTLCVVIFWDIFTSHSLLSLVSPSGSQVLAWVISFKVTCYLVLLRFSPILDILGCLLSIYVHDFFNSGLLHVPIVNSTNLCCLTMQVYSCECLFHNEYAAGNHLWLELNALHVVSKFFRCFCCCTQVGFPLKFASRSISWFVLFLAGIWPPIGHEPRHGFWRDCK